MLSPRKKKDESPRPLVVIIDDEPDLCAMLAVVLKEYGYGVEAAHDGKAGLDLIRAQQPDLVMLDIKMPRLNGYQVLAEMQQDAELSNTPVMVITSLADGAGPTELEWAEKLGVKHFVNKPFDPETVGQVVHRELSALQS